MLKQRGLSAKLMRGKPEFDRDQGVVRILDSSGQILSSFTYDDLRGTAWGRLYERYVGLHYESLGYSVDYRGLRLGFHDRGVDLDCRSATERLFIQCKFISSPLGSQRIAHLLYDASAFLARQHSGMRLHFALVVPSIRLAFGRVLDPGGRQQLRLKQFLCERPPKQDSCTRRGTPNEFCR